MTKDEIAQAVKRVHEHNAEVEAAALRVRVKGLETLLKAALDRANNADQAAAADREMAERLRSEVEARDMALEEQERHVMSYLREIEALREACEFALSHFEGAWEMTGKHPADHMRDYIDVLRDALNRADTLAGREDAPAPAEEENQG